MSEVPELTQLVLIRHGESVANATGTIGGPRSCTGLSDLGRQQCNRLARRLQATGELAGGVLYASHFPRAIETARLIAPAFGGVEPHVDEGFGEMDPGEEVDGMLYATFAEHYGTPDVVSDPNTSWFPGGESVAAMSLRVGDAVERAVADHPGRIIVVCTHGGTVEAAVRHVLGVPVGVRLGLWSTNASITSFFHTESGAPVWRLGRYNDAAHLLDGSAW